MDYMKESERHNKIVEKITNAKNIKELPNITISTLTKYLADNVSFDNKHIPSKEFIPVVEARLGYGIFLDSHVQDAFIEVLKKNYPDKKFEEYKEEYNKIVFLGRVERIMIEIAMRNEKIREFKNEEYLKKHNDIMHQINSAVEIKELPSVSRALISRFISDNSETQYNEKINVSKLKDIVSVLVDQKKSLQSGHFIFELNKICEKENSLKKDEIKEEIYLKLIEDKRLEYLIEEVIRKEERIKEIYKQEHDYIMLSIKEATRISELPPNVSISKITGYLSGNTTIYPKAKQIPSNVFNNIADMLLRGKKLDDSKVRHVLLGIATEYYPDKPHEAYKLLCEKLDKLPRLYYYVEEVKETRKLQQEFIKRAASDVYTYMIPNPKSPIDGGKFYNIYISRTTDLNLEEILPVNLEEIKSKVKDVDSIEWYVRQNYDKTFKLAGGLIVNKDETIGNVKIFRPSDGKIGITPEEKSKYDELKELSSQVKEIIKRKKEETDSFAKMQEAFLLSQQQIQEELSQLEERIEILTNEPDKVKKLTKNEE